MNDYKGILGFAMSALEQNPQVRNDPQYAEMVQAIEQNDAQKGMALANDILRRNGVTKGAAINQAIKFFNLPGQ